MYSNRILDGWVCRYIARYGDEQTMQYLVEKRKLMKCFIKDALYVSVEFCNMPVIRYLITTNDISEIQCLELIELAVKNNHSSVLQYLHCKYGYDIIESSETQLLKLAALNGCLEIIKWFFSHYSGFDEYTDTLCIAAENGHLSVVKWLLEDFQEEYNGEIIIDDDCADVALHCAVDTPHANLLIVQYLVQQY